MSGDIVLGSAGSRETGLPGTQELARINEDAKVTPQLLALMARHTQRKCSQHNMPYGIIATGTLGLKPWHTRERIHYTFTRTYILCTQKPDC